MAKRAATGYMLWLGENRTTIAKEYGLEGLCTVGKKAGELWKALDARHKHKYLDLAARDRERYEDEDRERYEDEVRILGKREVRSKGPARHKKRRKDPSAPKRPPSGYALWLGENRSRLIQELSLQGLNLPSVTKRLAEVWKGLEDAARVKYAGKAEEAKAQYRLRLEAYRSRPQGMAEAWAGQGGAGGGCRVQLPLAVARPLRRLEGDAQERSAKLPRAK